MDKITSEKWLKKAQEDLNWTYANIREKIWYGACFSAQQAAEKSLKAYLISRGKRVVKIHDLGALVEHCKKLDPSFEEIKEACVTLTDYYAPTRYPDIEEFMTLTKDRAEEAAKLAGNVLGFVEEHLTPKG